jgi:hypothetical protein
LREECRLKVFENKVLRRIFGPKRDEVTGEWRRLHSEDLYALYSSTNIIRVTTDVDRACSTYEERTGTYMTLVAKLERMTPLGRLDRCGSGYGQVAGSDKCGNEPSGYIKCGEFEFLET